MELAVLLVIAVPVGLAVWLIGRTVSAGKRIEELSARLLELELEVSRLKQSPAPEPASQTRPEGRSIATPSTRPPVTVFTPPIAPARANAIEPDAPSHLAPPPIPAFERTVPPIGSEPAPAVEPEVPLSAEPFAGKTIPAPPMPATPPLPKPQAAPPALEARAEPESPPVAPTLPAATPPSAEKGSFEMRLGTYWLVRVGIVMLLTGLVFFGNYAYQNFIVRLDAAGKVGLLYLASAFLLGAGAWWQRRAEKESLRNYAQVLFAGGLAAVYFTTYAAHHFPRLRVIENAACDGGLLLAWAGFMAWVADRRKSEVLALFAVGLAYYTSVITQVGAFTLYSNLVLTMAAVFFLVRNRWAGLSFASLTATYASYGFWRFYHAGEWRWAAPNERLWFGAYFLMSYWVVFTAAVFLSKHEKLAGESRAGFLTCNNGAFFTLFLLTMLQVRAGGFWKFSMSYGVALLGLMEAARRFLPAEPLAKNSYLTQGLLLVTLGFIAKFAGLQLALVLGAESVVLFVLGTQQRSVILQIAGGIAAALATGWGIDGLKPYATDGIWLGSALGALLAFNSFWAHRQKPSDDNAVWPVPAYFAALALAVWCFTTWQNTSHAHFGLALTLESLVLALLFYGLHVPEIAMLGQGLLLVAQTAWQFEPPKNISQLTALALAADGLALVQLGWKRNASACQAAGCIAAALAVAWGINGLERDLMTGLLTGIALAGMMVFKSFLAHRRDAGENQDAVRAVPTYFGVLTIALALATTWFNTSRTNFPVVLAAEALALTTSIYLLRVRELALLGQTLVLAGHCVWQFNLFHSGAPPWWNPAIMIGLTLGLGRWWQKQRVITLDMRVPLAFQGALALLLVLLVWAWLGQLCSNETWLPLACLLAVAITAYAAAMRAWLLAACAQLFLLPGAWLFLQQVSRADEPRFGALAPIAALGLLSFGAVSWFNRKPGAEARVREPLLILAMAYRWMALAMSLWWVLEYVPHREQIWVLMLIGLAVFAFAGWRRNHEALLFGAAFSGLAMLLLWVRAYEPSCVYLANLLTIVALLVQQQAAHRFSARFNLDARAHAAVIVVGGLTLWLFVSRWVLRSTSGFYLTASWSALALVLFACGMTLRERNYRWLGLAVLAGALGRVVVFDVWKLETVYRILSFLALGIVLLVLGFIYNKYQEKIRQWL